MKKIILFFLLLVFLVPCYAEQVYVKKDAILEKEEEPVMIDISTIVSANKTNILKLSKIKAEGLVEKFPDIDNISIANSVINLLLSTGDIVEYEKRYNELYPSAEVITP